MGEKINGVSCGVSKYQAEYRKKVKHVTAR